MNLLCIKIWCLRFVILKIYILPPDGSGAYTVFLFKDGLAYGALPQNLKSNAFCGITMDRTGNLVALICSLGSRDNIHIAH